MALPIWVLGRNLMPFKSMCRYLMSSSTRLGQAEFGNAVAQNAADLVLSFENGHVVSVSGQNDGDGDAGGAGATQRSTVDGAGPLVILLA